MGPTLWTTYRITFDTVMEATSHLLDQMLHSLLVDTKKTYPSLGDVCVKAGRAGCKFIELIGDNVIGDTVKTLVNGVHDVIDPHSGLCVPADSALSLS